MRASGELGHAGEGGFLGCAESCVAVQFRPQAILGLQGIRGPTVVVRFAFVLAALLPWSQQVPGSFGRMSAMQGPGSLEQAYTFKS